MGYPRRKYNKTKTFVGEFEARISEGLPLRAVPLMTRLLVGILARCQEKAPVEIAHFTFMENHYHMILFGEVKYYDKFFNMLNSLTARLIKKLTGQYPHGKVWERRYNVMEIETGYDVIKRILYIYLNPVKAGLVRRVRDWLGLSSFKWVHEGTKEIHSKFVPLRECFKKLTAEDFEKKDAEQLETFKKLKGEIHRLKLNPFGWKKFFPEYADKSDAEIWREICSEIEVLEQQYDKEFNGEFKGMEQVKAKPLVVAHTPAEHKPAPFLVCSDVQLRIQRIMERKEFCNLCSEAYKKLKCGIDAKFPKGAFRPRIPIIGRSRFVTA